MTGQAITSSTLEGLLPLITRGKVRNLYEIDADHLLFVATDRISAYDVVMKNGIPFKGCWLTLLSAHWFSLLAQRMPSLPTHLVSVELPSVIPAHLAASLRNRSMQVRKLQIFPIEAIVRGYLTGSAWKEYQRQGTVHGICVPGGMHESQAFAEPLYTPSTKADAGKNDENIHPDQALRLVGEKHGRKIERLALDIYRFARDYALARGIILADTKFEFGLDVATNEVVLVDEVLTPDSSRFWVASAYEVGRPQESFDKQYVRDWLVASGLQGQPGVELPEAVVQMTGQKYREAFERLTGTSAAAVLEGGEGEGVRIAPLS